MEIKIDFGTNNTIEVHQNSNRIWAWGEGTRLRAHTRSLFSTYCHKIGQKWLEISNFVVFSVTQTSQKQRTQYRYRTIIVHLTRKTWWLSSLKPQQIADGNRFCFVHWPHKTQPLNCLYKTKRFSENRYHW